MWSMRSSHRLKTTNRWQNCRSSAWSHRIMVVGCLSESKSASYCQEIECFTLRSYHITNSPQ
jgi:hypothetical protein